MDTLIFATVVIGIQGPLDNFFSRKISRHLCCNGKEREKYEDQMGNASNHSILHKPYLRILQGVNRRLNRQGGKEPLPQQNHKSRQQHQCGCCAQQHHADNESSHCDIWRKGSEEHYTECCSKQRSVPYDSFPWTYNSPNEGIEKLVPITR